MVSPVAICTVVIPATDRPTTLGRCLEAIAASHEPPDEVIVIDGPTGLSAAGARNAGLRRAIGTSSAIGFPIAVAGTVGYALAGRSVADLPAGSLGFVYLPALAAIAAGSWLTAPLGARATHRWPVSMLKKIFAGLLYVLGIRMAYGLLVG